MEEGVVLNMGLAGGMPEKGDRLSSPLTRHQHLGGEGSVALSLESLPRFWSVPLRSREQGCSA